VFDEFILMRKLLSLILCMVFLFNISGYYFVFKILQNNIRKEMKTLIKSTISEDETETIIISDSEMLSPSSSFKFLKKNEFTYKGKLYDIVHRKKENGINTFYCINDKQEEKLFSGLHEFIKFNMDNNIPVKNKLNSLIKNIVKEAIPDNLRSSFNDFSISDMFFTYRSNFTEQFISVLSPPPKA
jgi:hypothetical protein